VSRRLQKRQWSHGWSGGNPGRSLPGLWCMVWASGVGLWASEGNSWRLAPCTRKVQGFGCRVSDLGLGLGAAVCARFLVRGPPHALVADGLSAGRKSLQPPTQHLHTTTGGGSSQHSQRGGNAGQAEDDHGLDGSPAAADKRSIVGRGLAREFQKEGTQQP